MSKVNVRTDYMDRETAALQELSRTLKDYNDAVTRVHKKLRMKVRAQESLDQELRMLSDQILQEGARIDSLTGALECISQQYKKTEAKVLGLCTTPALAVHESTEKAVNAVKDAWAKLAEWKNKVCEDFRFWLVDHGLGKAERQKRVEGEPVTYRQQREMDRYLQQEIAAIKSDSRFSENTWKKASINDRKQILQDYLVRIAAILGLPALTIQWIYRQPQNNSVNRGSFSYGGVAGKSSVRINEWVIQNGDYTLLSTVVHEMRHYYQHEAVAHPEQFMVSAETIQSWEDSFKNYKSQSDFMADGMNSHDAMEAYRNQAVEVDARWFARQY